MSPATSSSSTPSPPPPAPAALYLFFAKMGAKSNPGIQSTWLTAPEGQLRLHVRVRQSSPTPCPAYFFTTAHVLRQLPVKLLKTVEPHVHLETDGVEGLFTIHLPPSRTLLNRLRRTWNALLGQDPMAELLFIEQTDSLNKTQQLREVHLDLEHRVQERTEELARLNAELKAMTINKSRHIANMSHELRTPLNANIGYSELLTEEVHATENLQMQADLSRITTAAGYLLSLVNNVLDRP